MSNSLPAVTPDAAQFIEQANAFYNFAKIARQGLVKLAPQYRQKDEFNAEGEYLRLIVLNMKMRSLCLRVAEKLNQNAKSDKLRIVKAVYHDADGSVTLFDEEGALIEDWPKDWPQRIADVQTFCRERGISYRF